MLAWKYFQKEKAPICPTANTTKIITKGPYSISRNPMYLGMLFMLMGYSVLIGSIITFIAPLAFFFIIDRVFIPFEEEKLKKSIGKEYAYYCRKVRRWI